MDLNALHDNQPYIHFGFLSLKNKWQKGRGSVSLFYVNKLELVCADCSSMASEQSTDGPAGRSALICSFFEPGCNRFIIVPRLQRCWAQIAISSFFSLNSDFHLSPFSSPASVSLS